MYIISTKRTKGSGKGIKMGFPTINTEISELPSGMEIGLYGAFIKYTTKRFTSYNYSISYKCLSLVSKFGTGFRIESHVISLQNNSPQVEVEVGQEIELVLLKKLREPVRTKDIKALIKNDVELVSNFFKDLKTCDDCKLCYVEDYGYSNYTVEGSRIGCYTNKFEEVEQDSSTIIEYSAISCDSFTLGESWKLDCDGEEPRPTKEWIESVMIVEERDRKIIDILDEK